MAINWNKLNSDSNFEKFKKKNKSENKKFVKKPKDKRPWKNLDF